MKMLCVVLPVAALAFAALRLPVAAQATPSAQASASVPPSGAALAGFDPKEALSNAKTVFIRSRTAFLDVNTFDQALMRQENWPKLKLVIVRDPKIADLLIELNRPALSYAETFSMVDRKTSAILGSGRIADVHGLIAPTPTELAKEIVKILCEARLPKAIP